MNFSLSFSFTYSLFLGGGGGLGPGPEHHRNQDHPGGQHRPAGDPKTDGNISVLKLELMGPLRHRSSFLLGTRSQSSM